MRILELKVSPNIHDYEYLESTDDASLLHSIEPLLSSLKDKLLLKLPRNVAKVTRYDDVLENLPLRQTYTSTELHSRISAEV